MNNNKVTYPVYSVRDNKVGFGNPMLDNNDATATRNFSYALQSGVMSHAPQDYDLYRIGIFDPESGMITCDKAPEFIISGVNAKDL